MLLGSFLMFTFIALCIISPFPCLYNSGLMAIVTQFLNIENLLLFEVVPGWRETLFNLVNECLFNVKVRIKVVLATFAGTVAAEAKSNAASWVILDRKLKQERKVCLEELRCNIVVIKGSHPKVLRLNLESSSEEPSHTPFFSAHSSPVLDHMITSHGHIYSHVMKHYSTPVSSPEDPRSPIYTRANPQQNLSFLLCQHNPLYEGPDSNIDKGKSHKENDPVGETTITISSLTKTFQNLRVHSGRASSKSPPLCSTCQLKAPSFGKPPKEFTYKELEEATDGFSSENFLAQGRFGLVHKGVLKDDMVVAVKQLKYIGTQADADFCREVRVLSCAQHRNVVLLVGFCIEQNRRLLVVGCIVHRDLRPKNILLTHDFEPLVTDFGLARLHSEWELSYDKRLGTSGYLAPEFFTDGRVTEKVDIYAFGLVLLELITGKKISNFLYYKWKNLLLGNHYCTSAKMEPIHVLAYKHQLLDCTLASTQLQNLPYELHAMGSAASLCLQREPHRRPPMSKVIRVLEGVALPLDLDSNRSHHSESRRTHCRRLSY
ncbi:unnamed protein product [Cuscuta campestris]|uniref:Protein kinase domain-containing protein n=1 Tax=Cuscuta campestris TaxID=132261 RepID=A0A484NMC4_9ASTE|nr:unnamed protein product [Cuscuta campestris]